MQAFRGYSLLEVVGHHLYELHGITLLHVEGEIVRLYLVESDKFVDEVLHLRAVADGHIQRLAHLLINLTGSDALQGGHDERERRLQFVRDHREEVRLHAVDLFDLRFLHIGKTDLGLLLHTQIIEEQSACHEGHESEEIDDVGKR